MKSGNTGSRNRNGNVPNVNWNSDNRTVNVNWYNASNSDSNNAVRSEVLRVQILQPTREHFGYFLEPPLQVKVVLVFNNIQLAGEADEAFQNFNFCPSVSERFYFFWPRRKSRRSYFLKNLQANVFYSYPNAKTVAFRNFICQPINNFVKFMQAVDKLDCSVGGGVTGHKIFEQIISVGNLLLAWREFSRGKRKKSEVQQFEFNLEDNLFSLQRELATKSYQVEPYTSFYITDPKLRHIHKASVRDRVLFQAVYRILYPIFDSAFIFDSYASRTGKGTHIAVDRLEQFLLKANDNNRAKIWALKCDISKFFDSINHKILFDLLCGRIVDEDTRWLIREIIGSFWIPDQACPAGRQVGNDRRRGLPLGNVTSQLFANIYLHELDFYIKHYLKIKYYLRYCDDFIILDRDRAGFQGLIDELRIFLKDNLQLTLHPRKVTIRSYHQGIDWLGYIARPHRRLLRAKTRRRMFLKINERNAPSYFGVLLHCDGYKIKRHLDDILNV